jgi:hypothetical protein
VNWTPDALDRLERAIDEGRRIRVRRGGTESVLTPRAIRDDYGGERLLALHLGTGDAVEVPLHEVEWFTVLE